MSPDRPEFLPSCALAQDIIDHRQPPRREHGFISTITFYPSWEEPSLTPNVESTRLFLGQCLERSIGTACRRFAHKINPSVSSVQLPITERGVFCSGRLESLPDWFFRAIVLDHVDRLLAAFAVEFEQWVMAHHDNLDWFSWNASRPGVDCIVFRPKPVL